MIYSKNNYYELRQGDMREELKNIPDNSIDSIITDPPYELGFMGKSWDNSGVSFQINTWSECLRVLKPGGHLLAFGGSRTFHRIACAIEDAGFEIRDTIMWLYGSGFPKSMNIGLAIDKKNGVQGEALYTMNVPDFDDTGKKQKEISGINKRSFGQVENAKRSEYVVRRATNEWDGWGTCLKPAYEPIIMARKPVEDSTINNCEKWGVGGINIDGCRIPLSDYEPDNRVGTNTTMNTKADTMWFGGRYSGGEVKVYKDNGRFPANVITDGSSEVSQGMPNTKSSDVKELDVSGYGFDVEIDSKQMAHGYNDNGSAMRYFYCAKASKKDRDEGLDNFKTTYSAISNQGKAELNRGNYEFSGNKEEAFNSFNKVYSGKNTHQTVKPTKLMQYLVRLISPKGATILDPFMGSGSTGKAAMIENQERNSDYKFIGIELTEEYLPVAKARIDFGIGYMPIPEDCEEVIFNKNHNELVEDKFVNKTMNKIKLF